MEPHEDEVAVTRADAEAAALQTTGVLRGPGEDIGKVHALDASVTVLYGSFDKVLVTEDWTPLEPKLLDEPRTSRRPVQPVRLIPPSGTDGARGRAPSRRDAWAVGNPGGKGLVEHWNEERWRIAFTADVEGGSNGFADISARSATDIWAVGDRGANGGEVKTLTAHFC